MSRALAAVPLLLVLVLSGCPKRIEFGPEGELTDPQALLAQVQKREQLSITVKGDAKIRWSFRNAWPSKWTGPAFNASGNAIAIETLEITHEELVRE